MHEYSIISDLVLLAESHAKAHSASKIDIITIEVGVRSAVEVDLLRSAFEVFKGESELCESAELKIELIEVALLCKTCGANFSAKGLEYGICKDCGGSDLEITKGRELNLARLEMH